MVILLLLACSEKTPPLMPRGDPARPDIVLVSVDTLRADHLSAYGYERPTSPFLERLAARGTRFAHARSAVPWTLPSHTTLLTGQLPGRHKVVEDSLRLPNSVPMLQERLTEAGYATGGFVATLYLSRVYGFERGFERFEDFNLHNEKANLSGEITADDVLGAARAWLSSLPEGKPFFLFVHVYDVHWGYDPPAPYDTMFDRAPTADDAKYRMYEWYIKNPVEPAQLQHQIAQYDEAIRYVDDQLGALDAALEGAGRQVRWAVTADHGEEFGERRSWGHAHTLYAEQLHVPLIVAGPGVPEGKVVSETVGLHDVAPTLLTLAGGSGLDPDGLDLGALMRGEALPARVFPSETSRFASNRVGLLEGTLRLEWNLKAGKRELFDVAADSKEAHDLAKERPDDVARLTELVRENLGRPWTAKEAGTVLGPSFLVDGPEGELKVEAGTRFNAMPHDGELRFVRDGATLGPWCATGCPAPGPADPLALEAHAAGKGADVELSAEQREALEALGYMGEEK